MLLKALFDDRYQVVAVMDGHIAPALDFLLQGDSNTEASRLGLLDMLQRVAELGFQGVPTKWTHEANKKEQIYEFVKGDLRLFYFKGEGRQIAVCTGGTLKKGQKADKAKVAQASLLKEAYWAAVQSNTLQVANNEDD